jgi:hypothetical protein
MHRAAWLATALSVGAAVVLLLAVAVDSISRKGRAQAGRA